MAISTIDAKLLQKMFLAGAKNLESKKEWINDLNVFPVPDGDTGTNMTLTIMSAAKEVNAIENPDMATLAKAISSGSLRGARGNSGVILSQLFRGFTKEIANVTEINTDILAAAMERAAETAYKAVMKPKEGTILTVARGAAEKAVQMAAQTDDIEEMIREVIEHAEYVLSQTPEMLPVLKEAGVVDSGGQGFVEVLHGAFDAFLGKELDFEVIPQGTVSPVLNTAKGYALDNVDIKFGYCTEFIIMLEKKFNLNTEIKFKAFLESIGDSIVCVTDDDVVKVHVHTNDPGLAIQKALTFGSLSRMKIDNMREEHSQMVIEQADLRAAEEAAKTQQEVLDVKAVPVGPKKDFGFVTIVAGEGLGEIFKGLGVDYAIEGGQTMNPSTEDILNAAELINADTIFVLPNNKNIILAAEQASQIIENKKIIVIPSNTVPQGIAAMINFEFSKNVEENKATMNDGMISVKSGQITYAVRDTSIDGIEIKCNDIMAIGDSGLITVGKDVKLTLIDAFKKLVDSDSELISLYYGCDIKEEDAEALRDEVEALYPNIDIELQFGGQPIYYYIFSVE
ncbi:DAK2 domain-containing protein [[Clostridium] fimetarium]|uniref:DhaL domain-containing protein n=1 Tax=[Clostridium] fimetarium TaxID=99656 RepID=A0A1I0QL66_9FIRM|nr:DAK2 domain-containing protein [[Clostridium] fimetarium]SEW27968.1 hypothetical protein SAMN05421659_108121 [[Clostridium] fimetarium]